THVAFADLPAALQRTIAAAGIGEGAFPACVERIDRETERRIAEGEREHLIYYALQSRRFTDRPPIEPAISARQFVDRLAPDERRRLLDDGAFQPHAGLPALERARIADLMTAVALERTDARLASFRESV